LRYLPNGRDFMDDVLTRRRKLLGLDASRLTRVFSATH